MASINKQDDWKDRKTDGGKGDYQHGDMRPYRAGAYWGVSDCCGSSLTLLNGNNVCDKCFNPCKKVKRVDKCGSCAKPFSDDDHKHSDNALGDICESCYYGEEIDSN